LGCVTIQLHRVMKSNTARFDCQVAYYLHRLCEVGLGYGWAPGWQVPR
jgi:hypothetical protein